MRDQDSIHKMGFRLSGLDNSSTEYVRAKIGSKSVNDVIVDLKYVEQKRRRLFERREDVLKALLHNDIIALREISNQFYRVSGIYQKVVNYVANMYRYDWYLVAEPFTETVKEEKVITDFNKALRYLDNSQIKNMCGRMSLAVVKDGVYYGYAYEGTDGILVQELPWRWCRSRFEIQGAPAIEFNMKFFDTTFKNVAYRLKVLDLFPPEFQKGYLLYKQGKLPSDNLTEKYGSWYLLDPACAFKIAINGLNDMPLFINAIPEIIDLDLAEEVDKKRQLQKLLKIVVQKLPLDKNNDLIFDIEEAKDIHNNAVDMLSSAIGVDVLTTFADIDAIDVSDATSYAKDNSLENSQNNVYNALGVSKNIFNTDGNLALATSILVDEGQIRNLIYQYERLYNKLIQKKSSSPKKWGFRFYMMYTTQFNYQALSKLYKEQTQVGFSKMLPQIALGQSQSFILNSAYFENELLHLSEIMLPPLMSSTMSAEDLANLDKTKQESNNKTEKQTGRPPKEETELSEKTIQNKETAT